MHSLRALNPTINCGPFDVCLSVGSSCRVSRPAFGGSRNADLPGLVPGGSSDPTGDPVNLRINRAHSVGGGRLVCPIYSCGRFRRGGTPSAAIISPIVETLPSLRSLRPGFRPTLQSVNDLRQNGFVSSKKGYQLPTLYLKCIRLLLIDNDLRRNGFVSSKIGAPNSILPSLFD